MHDVDRVKLTLVERQAIVMACQARLNELQKVKTEDPATKMDIKVYTDIKKFFEYSISASIAYIKQ